MKSNMKRVQYISKVVGERPDPRKAGFSPSTIKRAIVASDTWEERLMQLLAGYVWKG